MNNETHDNNNGQFALSYELLYLLQWLIEHESETIKKMIQRAVKYGYRNQTVTSNDFVELQVSDDVQQSIVEFLSMMDTMLMDEQNDHGVTKFLQHNLIPAIRHIDQSICDAATVETSIAKATAKLSHSKEKPQEILFKELLKRWKPQKKSGLN